MTTLTTNNKRFSSPEQAIRQLPALFNEAWLDSLFCHPERAWDVPNAVYPYNILAVRDKDGEIKTYEVEVALAGVGKDFIQVKVKDGQLQIDVNPSPVEENPDHPTIFFKRGLSQRVAYLKFNLDKKVDCKNITSSYINGLLKVVIPINKPEAYNISINVE